MGREALERERITAEEVRVGQSLILIGKKSKLLKRLKFGGKHSPSVPKGRRCYEVAPYSTAFDFRVTEQTYNMGCNRKR